MDETPTMASIAPADLAPTADEARAVIDNTIKVWAEVIKIIADFVAAIERFAPVIRKAHRHLSLADHRRHQDERRCLAKAGRRERTGWRQSA